MEMLYWSKGRYDEAEWRTIPVISESVAQEPKA
jgi:hypothetical protein